MLLSKRRGTKLMVAAMVYLVAVASAWSACANCAPLVNASEMGASADHESAPCPAHGTVGDQATSAWSGLMVACLDIAQNDAEAVQFTNPYPTRLAATLLGGFDDGLAISRLRLTSAALFYTPASPPAVPRTLLARKTLLRV